MISWILLVSRSHAIIFSVTKDRYEIVKKFKNEVAELKKSQIYSDRPGSTQYSGGHDTGPVEERRYMEVIDHRFATMVMDYIDKARHLGKFSTLRIVASKSIIGDIRSLVNTSLEQKITNEILKNFYTEKVHELKDFLKTNEALAYQARAS